MPIKNTTYEQKRKLTHRLKTIRRQLTPNRLKPKKQPQTQKKKTKEPNQRPREENYNRQTTKLKFQRKRSTILKVIVILYKNIFDRPNHQEHWFFPIIPPPPYQQFFKKIIAYSTSKFNIVQPWLLHLLPYEHILKKSGVLVPDVIGR